MKKLVSKLLTVFLVMALTAPHSGAAELISEEYGYFYEDFSIAPGMYIYSGSNEVKAADGMLHFKAAENAAAAAYADIYCKNVNNTDSYIAEAFVLPEAIENSSAIRLFDSKTDDNKWRFGLCFSSDGIIRMNDEEIGKWTGGVGMRISMAFNTSLGSCDVYINNVLKKTLSVNTKKTSVFRIEMTKAQSDAKTDFYIDDVLLYPGTSPSENISGIICPKSVLDKEMEAEKIIDSASVFMLYGDNYYENYEKKKYTAQNEKPYIKDSQVYITPEFAKMHLSLDVTSDITAQAAAEKAGKHYLFDKRGYFVISDSEFTCKDSENFSEMFENADILYRYVQFENPSGEEIINKYKSGAMHKKHPRIIFTEEDLAYILGKKEETQIKLSISNSLRSAENEMNRNDFFAENCSADEKFEISRQFQYTSEKLATAYLLSGDTKYADKAIEYLKNMLKWKSVSYSASNLNIGHYAKGLAVCYDTFYNYLNETQEGREILRSAENAAKQLIFNDSIAAYKGVPDKPHYITITDNFSGVISGGVMSLLIAMADAEELEDEIIYLLENELKTMQISVSMFQRDGGYFEGADYSLYMLSNLTGAIENLISCCGTDFGLGNACGFKKSGEFFVYLQGKSNVLNFHDSTDEFAATAITYWFAYRYGEMMGASLAEEQIRTKSVITPVKSLLYLEKAKEMYTKPDINDAAPDRYFSLTEAVSFRDSFAVSNPVFCGFHAGRTGITHDSLDVGQFVFEADGVPWAVDLGGDDYSLPDYFGKNGYKIYRKRPEGENCIVINPEDDSQNYYGQKIGADTKFVKIESKDRGAIAVCDLTDAYERDVNSYKRGFFFTDDRNTLVIQDEISLKKTSEIYWFMHTPAEISVEGNKAYLTYGGKKLRAEILCSGGDFTVSSMNAEPLSCSPTVSGQNKNSGITKLAIHIQNAAENVTVSVKLFPENRTYYQTGHTMIPMDNWQIPDGDKQVKFCFYDTKLSPAKFLTTMLQMPENADKLKLFIDDREIDAPASSESDMLIGPIDVSALDFGRHILRAEANDGIYKDEVIFMTESFGEDIIYENSLSNYNGAEIYPGNGWVFYRIGSGQNNGDSYSQKSNGIDYTTLGIRTYETDKAIKKGKILINFDVKFEDLSSNFLVECLNAEEKWFMHTNYIFSGGKIAGGDDFESDRWYNVCLYIDTARNLCDVYVDNIPVIKGYHNKNINSFMGCKLQYSAYDSGAMVYYKNFSVKQLSFFEDTNYITLSADGENIFAEVNDSDIIDKYNPVMLVLAAYDQNKNLISADVIRDYKIGMKAQIKTDSDISYFKCLLMQNMKPLQCALYEYNN